MIMAKIHFISFAEGDEFRTSRKKIIKEAKELHFFSSVKMYGKKNLPSSLLSLPIFQYERGFGYWTWKPWIILDKLNHVSYGDIVVYADCGCVIHKNLEGWKSIVSKVDNNDILVFKYRASEYTIIKKWTKKRVLQYFWSNDYEKVLNDTQNPSGFIIVRKTKNSEAFISDWLSIMLLYPDLVIDVFGTERNDQLAEFEENRHDQAILTGLVLTTRGVNIVSEFETFEPSLKHINPFITAARRKDAPKLSLKKRLTKYIKTTTYEYINADMANVAIYIWEGGFAA